jgi:hypothetical protein
MKKKRCEPGKHDWTQDLLGCEEFTFKLRGLTGVDANQS